MNRGEEYYEQSRFDEAITLLRTLLERGSIPGDAANRARELLARAYVKKGYPAQAKDMFREILREQPAYRPDPIRVPPDEAAVFEIALREFRAEGGARAGAPAPGSGPPGAAESGTLEIRVRPYATYYVDDIPRSSNVAFARLSVRPGVHVVRAMHPSFEPKVWKIQVAAGKVMQLDHDFLATPPGRVRVSSGGVWAEVFVDGLSSGRTTPCILEDLSMGRHVVTVARAGFAAPGGSQVVNVRPGSDAQLSFTLTRSR